MRQSSAPGFSGHTLYSSAPRLPFGSFVARIPGGMFSGMQLSPPKVIRSMSRDLTRSDSATDAAANTALSPSEAQTMSTAG